MTSDDAVSAAVARLAKAQATGVPCAPVRDLIGTDDLPAAYAVQQGLVQGRIAAGAEVVGRKIGATSLAVQQQLGVDQPDFGYLLDEMDVSAHDGAPISMHTLLQPRVEAEVAFVLARDIAPATEEEITLAAVRDAVEVAMPALEIVDSRIEGWNIGFTDTVADNASSGLYVVAAREAGRPLSEVEPIDVVMSLSINGEVRLDAGSVGDLSPARQAPVTDAPLWLAVGDDETGGFHRQHGLMLDRWSRVAKGHSCPGHHHFSILDELAEPGGQLHDLVLSLMESNP